MAASRLLRPTTLVPVLLLPPILAGLMSAHAAEPYRKVLTDVDTSLRVEEWSLDASRLDPAARERWSIRKRTLHGGRQEGVDVVEVDGGRLSFRVVPTRGMQIQDARCDGVRLGWDSPVKEVVHPAFVNLDGRGGLGWLEGFGELVSRCGLASNGAPCVDRVPANTGEIVEVRLTLHGKIGYIPARRVEVIVDPPPERRIRVRGVVDETMMFGPRLRLVTEVSTLPGSSELTIRDEIVNLGATEQEMQILYHCNFGPPILGDGATFHAPLERVAPRDARAAEGGLRDWDRFGPPQAGYVEQVYFLRLLADERGRTSAMLRAPDGERGAAIDFSTRQLPCVTLWKNTAAEADGYVTGIEPGTNYPNPRSVERERGRVPKLAAGESYRTELTIRALTSPEEVREARARIEGIRRGRESEVLTRPSDD